MKVLLNLLAMGVLLPLAYTNVIHNPNRKLLLSLVEKRAGAPAWGNINNAPCPPTNPLFCAGPPSTCTAVQNSTNYRVNATTNTAAQIWSYYLPINDWPAATMQQQALISRCASMCYGYGSPGDCQAFYMAFNVSGPKWYGNVGGDPRVSCQIYNRPLLLKDFEIINSTARYNATAGNVNCDQISAQGAGANVQLGGFAYDSAPASIASSTSLPPMSSSMGASTGSSISMSITSSTVSSSSSSMIPTSSSSSSSASAH